MIPLFPVLQCSTGSTAALQSTTYIQNYITSTTCIQPWIHSCDLGVLLQALTWCDLKQLSFSPGLYLPDLGDTVKGDPPEVISMAASRAYPVDTKFTPWSSNYPAMGSWYLISSLGAIPEHLTEFLLYSPSLFLLYCL